MARTKPVLVVNETCAGGKHSKRQMKCVSAASMVGEKLAPACYWQGSKQECFKNVKKKLCKTTPLPNQLESLDDVDHFQNMG